MNMPPIDRKALTFSQAEGVSPLPGPLALGELSKELRSLLWAVIYSDIRKDMSSSGHTFSLGRRWRTLLLDKHVFFDHELIDEFQDETKEHVAALKRVISQGDYAEVFDLLQFMLRHTGTGEAFSLHIGKCFQEGRAAYRVVDGDTIVPQASEQEGEALSLALSDLSGGPFKGARSHLKAAADMLSRGKWGDSIRESISAVEAVARVWEPTATSLGPALKSLGNAHRLHPALLNGFGKLYGFTNDEQGIRHALLDEQSPRVDEADAVYMLGACAAFTSYLSRRHRESNEGS